MDIPDGGQGLQAYLRRLQFLLLQAVGFEQRTNAALLGHLLVTLGLECQLGLCGLQFSGAWYFSWAWHWRRGLRVGQDR